MKEKLTYALGWAIEYTDKWWMIILVIAIAVWLIGSGPILAGLGLTLMYIFGTLTGFNYALNPRLTKKEEEKK